MSIENYLNSLKHLIDKTLGEYLPSEKKEPKIIHKAMRYSMLYGGKRIRPILAIESCRACGGRLKEILPVAAAIELVHAYSLIHDDLPAMDDDDYRRGRPACHRAFGEANAILAGDALLTLAFNIISRKTNSRTGLVVIKELSDAIGTNGMIGGQAADLKFSSTRISGSAKTLNRINRLKTSRLFEASTKLGAMAAGSSLREVEAMARFGASLGMAFQITDDVIDQEGYVNIVGMDKAKRDAKNLIERAKCALNIFGKKADRLKDMADCILIRGK